MLGELVRAGYLEDAGTSASRGGRPSAVVRISQRMRFVGIQVGATSVDVAVTDGELKILGDLHEECDVRSGPEAILSLALSMTDKLRDQGLLDKVDGVGVGVPGPVHSAEGIMVSPPLIPSWDGYPIREHVGREIGSPTVVDNDVNVMAIGERHAGVARNVDEFLFIKLGTGIGCGVVLNGQIYRGPAGSAGDIGHIAVEQRLTGRDGALCLCGRRGCLEALCGGPALARQATEKAESGQSAILASLLAQDGVLTAKSISTAAVLGDAQAIQIIETTALRVGLVLSGLVNFANPSMIVIGGGVSGFGTHFLASLRSAVYQGSTPLATQHLPIVMSELGDSSGTIGAAYYASERVFRRV